MSTKILSFHGFFTQYDNQYNRATIMFLDDYDNSELRPSKNIEFTKKYILRKHESHYGKSPLLDDKKSFIIKCPKHAMVWVSTQDSIKLVDSPRNAIPIESLKQHKISCDIKIKEYNFKTSNGIRKHGWNINLIKMHLLEL